MPDNIGTGPYSGGAVRSKSATVLQVIRRKIELKTQLALETSRLETLLPTLSPEENAEVRAALAADDAQLDQDVAALAREANRLAREAAAAKAIRPLSVTLSKAASGILAREIERRLNQGHCPDLAILAEQAIRATYGGAS